MKITLNETTVEIDSGENGKSTGGDVRAKLPSELRGYQLFREGRPTDDVITDTREVLGMSFTRFRHAMVRDNAK